MSDTWKAIVIGTSLSEESDEIVRIGVSIAQATESLPWLVHVYTLPVFQPELGPLDEVWIEAYEEGLRARLALQAERTGLTSLPGFDRGQLRLALEQTAAGIVQLARQVDAELIVVGAADAADAADAGHAGDPRPHGVGSTADGVVRDAPCPVLVVRSASTFPPTRVEIPVDLSPISANALRQGMDFLTELGVKLNETEALFVLSPWEVASSCHFTPEQIERFALSELHLFLESHGGDLLRARKQTGHPWEEILSVLGERNAELVILGTHGSQGYDRLLLGSVASGVMQGADCNLLVVPPDAALRKETAREHGEQIFGGDWNFIFDDAPVPVGAREETWQAS
jgi:nucleotide-binding universal stress UspA family protein